MQGFNEDNFTVKDSVKVTTSTGMVQTRQLRVNRKTETYISVEGYSEQSALDSLFFFENREVALEQWDKIKDIQDLKNSMIDFKEHIRLHHYHYDNKGNILKTYD